MNDSILSSPVKRSNWVCLAFAIGFTFVYSIYMLGGLAYDITLPAGISGDGIFHSLLVKRIISEESYFLSKVLGFPFGATLYDFPGSDSLSLAFLYAIGKITSDYIVAINAYFLIGFPLSALTFALAARNMGLAPLPSAVGGILFAFLPFHFMRLNHLYYTWYFVVPLYIWYGWWVYRCGFDLTQRRSRFFWAFWCIGLALLASTGVYYAVFGIVVFITAGILGAVDSKSFKSLAFAAVASATVLAAVLVNVGPNLIYKFNHGANVVVAQRMPQESEVYGLKISQLLLPWPGHRSPSTQTKSQLYRNSYPLVNENSTASLGLVGAIGFLGLLAALVFGRRPANEPNPLRFMPVVLLALLLTATIGGFGSLFALFVSPQIRAWNRVSVYIAFFSIAAAMFALAWARESLSKWRLGAFTGSIVSVLVLLLGLWDQTSPPCSKGCIAKHRSDFAKEKLFFSKVQEALPNGAAVYTLPFMEFPEPAPKHELKSYDVAVGYLYTNGLRWSYGSMKGRDQADSVFRKLEEKSAAEQVREIRKLGYSGILIDRRGYLNRVSAIEQDLVNSGEVQLIAVQDFRAFYILAR